MDNEVIGNRINNMLWNVMDLSASPFKLLTSDWPLVKIIEGDRVLFALPINPTRLFTAVSHLEVFNSLRQRSPKELTVMINTEVVSRARRYVYAVDRKQEQFVANRMSSGMVTPPFFPSLARNPS